MITMTTMICHLRYSDRRGTAADRTTLVVHNCSQPVHHQLYRISNQHRDNWNQSLPVYLLAYHVWHSVYSLPHYHRCGFDVGDRCCPRLTEPRWLVVALVRYQDSEVSVGPHRRLPLHDPICRRRHAVAFRNHHPLLLAHLRSYPSCQAAHSQNTATGKW